MTTILADFKLGLMVADSGFSDGDRVWSGRKVHRHKGALLGLAGDVNEGQLFLTWWKRGCTGKPPTFVHSQALVLDEQGLRCFNAACVGERIAGGVEAIGSGAKAAICAYEALGLCDPARAVRIVCRHDSGSRAPVRVYRLVGVVGKRGRLTRNL